MVCWSENLDWRKILAKLGLPVSEEDKSKAIWDLEDDMGHDYLKSLPEEERARLILEKLQELKGLRAPKKKKKKSSKRHEHDEEKEIDEEEPAQSFYM
jgi:hypothetical protein